MEHQSSASREERFTRVFHAHYLPVLRFARRRLNSDEDAQESASEVFMIAWRRFDEVPPEPITLPWLFGVARRVVANRRRGNARRARLVDRLGSVMGFRAQATPDPGSDARLDLAPVLQALARLPESDQELLRLIAWEGLDHAEVATVLGISVANVAVRVYRARRRLRGEMERLADRPGVGVAAPPPTIVPLRVAVRPAGALEEELS